MKIALISVMAGGTDISLKIADKLFGKHSCSVYAFDKYAADNTVPFSDLRVLTDEIFDSVDALIYVCACGIAVRMIAPYIVSKLSDPAVIVIDEQGKFVIPLLSGHIGGANVIAEKIAEIIGASPVITTATDAGGRFSPDSFAAANDLFICEMALAKLAAAEIVNGRKIGFYSDFPCENVPENYFDNSAETGICISADNKKNPFAQTLHLIPKNIDIGLGCKKNTPPEQLESFIMDTLADCNIGIARVKAIQSIDVKRNETAIADFCRKYRLASHFYSAKELSGVAGVFGSSDFVQKTVGVDNVCERSAAYNGGKIILPKTICGGMTIALAEERVSIDFERRIL